MTNKETLRQAWKKAYKRNRRELESGNYIMVREDGPQTRQRIHFGPKNKLYKFEVGNKEGFKPEYSSDQ